MEGLGQVGAQAPQQDQGQPEEKPFTLETAGMLNAGVIKDVGSRMPKKQVPQEPVKAEGLGRLDVGAMEAVKRGMVDPREVLNDPNISGVAKQEIARGLQLA